jgi:hypothetical protein
MSNSALIIYSVARPNAVADSNPAHRSPVHPGAIPVALFPDTCLWLSPMIATPLYGACQPGPITHRQVSRARQRAILIDAGQHVAGAIVLILQRRAIADPHGRVAAWPVQPNDLFFGRRIIWLDSPQWAGPLTVLFTVEEKLVEPPGLLELPNLSQSLGRVTGISHPAIPIVLIVRPTWL